MTDARKLFDAIKSFVDKKLSSANDRIKELEDKISALSSLPVPSSVSLDDVQRIIDACMKSIEIPQIDYEAISKTILDEVSKIEVKHGEDGKDAEVDYDRIEKYVLDAISKIEVKDGKDAEVDYDAIRQEIVKEVSKIEVHDGKDAEIDYDKITLQMEKMVRDEVSKIEIKHGEDGMDALEIEILPAIHPAKSYHRGTYATHNGGLWRSFKSTNGMEGWECIVSGVSEIDIDYDGERKAVIRVNGSDGKVIEKELRIPAMIHKGVWREGKYEKGDHVQLSGSMWICLNETTDRPNEGSKNWMVGAKRGGTGKSAFDIAREAGFEGTKQEWIASIGKKPKVEV